MTHPLLLLRRPRRVAALGTLLALCGLATAAGACLVYAVRAWADREPFAEPSSTTALWLGFAAFVLLVAASLAVSLLRGTAARRSAVAALGSAMLLALGGGAAAASSGGCETFAFERGEWRTALDRATRERSGEVGDAERIARAIVECGLLDGLDRADVRRRLGMPDGRATDRDRVDFWRVGMVFDGLGPGDEGRLSVQYDAVGRVAEVYSPG